MNLIQLGWNSFFEESFKQYKEQGYSPGRVAVQRKGSYELMSESGTYTGELSGKFHQRAEVLSDRPAVGDWVALSLRRDEQKATIHAVLTRKSSFSRKAVSSGGTPDGGRTDEQILAANIDTVFLVSGLDNDFNPRRIERYLLTAYDSGATPVILLNKADLCDNIDAKVAELEDVDFGIDIHTISAISSDGKEKLTPYLTEGRTVALLGSSGVGKTTIVNWMLGTDQYATAEVRGSDSRGRHTTTHRELIVLPDGGILIDTPGMRELKLWSDETSLKQTFEDVVSFASQCKFADCHHESEPGCAVRQAINSKELDKKRLDSYLKLQRELKRLEIRKSGKESHLNKVRGKKFAKMVNEAIKLKIRRR